MQVAVNCQDGAMLEKICPFYQRLHKLMAGGRESPADTSRRHGNLKPVGAPKADDTKPTKNVQTKAVSAKNVSSFIIDI
jgi:hypothetical protein